MNSFCRPYLLDEITHSHASANSVQGFVTGAILSLVLFNRPIYIRQWYFWFLSNQVNMAVLPRQWVFGGICRESGESFMFTIPDRSAAPLLPIIWNTIRPGTRIIYIYQWPAYNGTVRLPGEGFQHATVNYSVNFVDPHTEANTQRIERSWKAAKGRNKRHNGTQRSEKHVGLIHVRI